MSHVLGMTVVAEGVETVERRREVEALGCESCQGFYFARPMRADALNTMLQIGTVDVDLRLPLPVG